MNAIKKILQQEMFHPGLIGLVLNPFYHARWCLRRGIKQTALHLGGSLLDVGCGSKPYRSLFTFSRYTGLDTDNSGHSHHDEDIDVIYDGKFFPFANGEFDSVLCNQVLEHVFEPSLLLREVNRVIKPGSKCLFTVPFVWDEHEQPYDFARYSSFGLRYLFEQHGFRVVEQKKLMPDFRVIVQLTNGYLYKCTRKIPGIKQLVQLLLIFPLNLLGWLLAALPDNKDLYLDNLIVVEKIKEIS